MEDFYSIYQRDYINILAVTHRGLTPIVRQFRAAIEAYTWELPAGTREVGETPRAAASRELKEETGLKVIEIVSIGRSYVDTARLSNRFYSFVAVAKPTGRTGNELGVEARLIPVARLRDMILKGEFCLQTHIGLVYSAMIHPAAVRLFARHGLSDVSRQFRT